MKSDSALLWDESFLWGLMAYKALMSCNLSFELIRSSDIKNGRLKNFRMLFVPGGWASNKIKTLGDEGINEIKKFVQKGGSYLGLCGGAGLATMDGIGLLNIKRMPTRQRVPSFSGRIYLNINEHPIWQSVNLDLNPLSITDTKHGHNSPIFHAWWPSQFVIDDKDISILARYADALPDSFSSDLNVGDIEANGRWQELEGVYKINLDPEGLKDEPAVVEGRYGKGNVILSLIHFDTPDDRNGAVVLKNIWEYLKCQGVSASGHQNIKDSEILKIKGIDTIISDLETAVDDLISLGTRNFLWFWRNPMLLQWRRGVRGLEYCTLYIMIKELKELIKNRQIQDQKQEIELNKIKDLLIPFTQKAKRLLILERLAMQNGHITYEKCSDPAINALRIELFGNSKSHGGLFKILIDNIDSLLFKLLTFKGLSA